MLDDAEWFWVHEVNACARRLDECYAEAAYGGERGLYVDCSGLEDNLAEAQSRLARIRAVQRETAAVVARYRPLHARYAYMLDVEGIRTREFLADLIEALEAYRAVRIGNQAGEAIGAGIGKAIAGVVSVVRRAQRDLHTLAGETGERVTAQVLSGQFALQPLPLTPPSGFRHLFRAPGVPLIVAERAGPLAPEPAVETVAGLAANLGLDRPPSVIVISDPVTGLADVFVRSLSGAWQRARTGVALDEAVRDASLGTPDDDPNDSE